MRLLSCKIENFGKLHETEVNFTEGLNVILRENGYGKSTLAAFIRIMFYGLQGDRKQQEPENDRKKYAPWQGGTFGGQLQFETMHQGRPKTYRIVRTFGNRKSQDHFALYDAETGLVTNDYSENIGEELFHIDELSFRRTVFIGQSEIETAVTSGMSAKIGNVATDLDDMNRYTEVMEQLKNELNALSPARRTGEIFKKRMELEMLRSGLHEKKALEQRFENAAVRLHQAGEQQRALTRAIESLHGRMQNAAELQEQEKARLTLQNMERERQEIASRAIEAEKRYFGEAYAGMTQAERDQEIVGTLQQLDNLFLHGIPQEAELSAHEKEISRMEFLDGRRLQIVQHLNPGRNRGREAEPGTFSGFMLLGLVSLLTGLGLILYTTTGAGTMLPGAVALFIGLVFLILYFRQRTERKHRVQRRSEIAAQALEKLDQERENLRLAVTAFLGKYYPVETAALRRDQYAFSGPSSANAPANDMARDLDFDLSTVNEGGKSSASSLLRRLGNDVYHYSRLEDIRRFREEYSIKRKEIAEFQRTHPLPDRKSRGMAGKIDSMESLSQRLSELTKEQGEIADRILSIRGEKQAAETALEELYRKEREYQVGLEELSRLENRYNLLILTRDHLSAAKDQFTAVYLKPMMEAFTKYYHILTGTENQAGVPYQMDAAFNVHLLAAGQERNTDLLSQGFQNLVELCRRMAFIDAMYPEERPFVLLDDPFVNLDQDKIQGGLRFLETVASEGSQVVYFTCHDSRK